MLIADESSCFSTVKISSSIENEVVFNEARIVFVFAVLISAGSRTWGRSNPATRLQSIACGALGHPVGGPPMQLPAPWIAPGTARRLNAFECSQG